MVLQTRRASPSIYKCLAATFGVPEQQDIFFAASVRIPSALQAFQDLYISDTAMETRSGRPEGACLVSPCY